ncbi:hypothetical protein [Streptosporangium sp. NBC_01756]|uniref:hypothetical protein n=1 Tax=Streptosporangium sp. NBC_01756 TaxID=2975950 RepID=UPI002DDBB478|nr:hypothetical protein [Streptosporangium sp. NBC_01756]WSC84960.1 hypothetical protein OIE48_32015 [Streptosporangium sp. NBC_01756]
MNGSLAGFEERRLAELKEHVAARAAAGRVRRPRRRIVLAVATGAAVAAASVVTVSSIGGAAPAYAVTKDSDGIVHVTVRDTVLGDVPDVKGLTRQLQSLDVPAIVDYVPAGQKCKEPRGAIVTDIPRDLYHTPTNIPGDPGAWQMQIDTKLFKPDQTFVWTLYVDPVNGWNGTSTILMRDPVAPCELVPDDRPHYLARTPSPWLKATSLGGYQVKGKTVGEVLPEIDKRGLEVTYLVTEPAPDKPRDPDMLYVMYSTKQNTPVGNDWSVWQADEPAKGVIRLYVTQKPATPQQH